MKKILKRVDWSDMFGIYLLWTIIFIVTQGLVLAMLGLLNPSRAIIFLFGPLLTVSVIFILCKMFKWHLLFHAVRSNLVLTLLLFVLSFIAWIMMFISNFTLDFSYIFFSVVTIIFSGVAISPFFARIYHRVMGFISSDDLKTDLWHTALDMIEEPDADKRYAIYAELAGRYGKNVSSYIEEKKKGDAQQERMETTEIEIKQYIYDKLQEAGKTVEVDTFIRYYTDYDTVTYEQAKKWLTMLLEYAFKSLKENPIYVRMFVFENSFSMEISSECTAGDEQAFKSEFMTLYEEINTLNGEIITKEYEMGYHESLYLETSIQIKNGDKQRFS